jgi:hypothetical protein
MWQPLSLLRCTPQDFVNSFTPYAVLATVRFGALLLLTALLAIVLIGALRARPAWLSPRLKGLGIGLVAVNVVLCVAALAEMGWMWLQAHAFISWCSAGPTPALFAQAQRLADVTHLSQVSTVLVWLLCLLNLVIVALLLVRARQHS